MNIIVKNFDPSNPIHQALTKVTEVPKPKIVRDIPKGFLHEIIQLTETELNVLTPTECGALRSIRERCELQLKLQQEIRDRKHARP